MEAVKYTEYNAIAMDRSGVIGYICDMESCELLYMSKACMELCGLQKPEDYLGQPCYRLLQGLDAPCPFCTNAKLRTRDEYRWEHYNEKLGRWFDVTDRRIELEGRACRLEIAKDITARREKLGALQKQLSLEDMLFRCLNTLTMEPDMDAAVNLFLQAVGGYYGANRAYIIEFDLKRQMSNNTFEWCAPGVSAEIDNLQDIPISVMDHWIYKFETVGEFSIDSLDDDLDPEAEDYRILQAQGIESLLAAPLRRDGQIVGFVGVDDPCSSKRDLTLLRAVSGFVLVELEKRRLMAEMERLSFVDPLTGLHNRNRFAHDLRDFDVCPPAALGVIAVDINGLQQINDTHGYDYGDFVLKRTAQVLQSHFSTGVYRIGSDEFTALCPLSSKEDFQGQVVALRQSFDREPACDISLGFAWAGGADAADPRILLQKAGEMRHAEKRSYYQSFLREGRALSRGGFADEVRREVEENRFLVFYQPQIDLQTGRVAGAEALVRKRAEDGSLIPPGKFIPFYEVGGAVNHVDLFVMRTACAALRDWQAQGLALRIAVNFSRVTLLQPHIVEDLLEICAGCGVSPASIAIEVTESIGKMDNEQLKALFEKLKAAGFSISLDDFGSQYSNLAILAMMDFDEVKFDRSLVSSLEENRKSRLVIESGLGLCRGLGKTASLAEGIETEGQLELLKSFGCDYGQGYYFSRPVPPEAFNAYLHTCANN